MSDAEPVSPETQAAEPPGLPPVEPPSAGFIVQLFIVPAVIVVVIVMVWLSFSWLAHLGEDPETYIRQLKKRDWHAAYNLAQSLAQSQKNKALVENKLYAQEVADVLKAELAQKSFEPEPVMFRQFLCKSLGYFHVDTGLPVLIEAAETQRDEREIPVQCEAIEAIMQLTRNLQQADPPQDIATPELLEVLVAAANDDAQYVEPADEKNKQVEKVWSVRERGVYALGLVGSEEANEELKNFLDSSEPNVRYNAAAGLARHGIATDRSVAVFKEMLDPNAGVASETDDSAKSLKRRNILRAALPAIGAIIAADTTVDLSPLKEPLEVVAGDADDKEAQIQARSLLVQIAERDSK